MRSLSVILLTSALSFVGCAQRSSKLAEVPKEPNPHQVGTQAWVKHEWEHLAQLLDAAKPGYGAKFRQNTNLAFLQVGMMYQVSEYGLGDRQISRSGPTGSTTTFIHKIGEGYTYVTVDDATWIVTAITRDFP
ncbi:MAG: hypothetical protein L0Y42_13695 [Phycisphaerales bacterium]|nr:hypothetical protein [Phycisphaerales bacterium]